PNHRRLQWLLQSTRRHSRSVQLPSAAVLRIYVFWYLKVAYLGIDEAITPENETFPGIVGKLIFLRKMQGFGRTRLFTKSAEDAAEHVDLVGVGVPLSG